MNTQTVRFTDLKAGDTVILPTKIAGTTFLTKVHSIEKAYRSSERTGGQRWRVEFENEKYLYVTGAALAVRVL